MHDIRNINVMTVALGLLGAGLLGALGAGCGGGPAGGGGGGGGPGGELAEGQAVTASGAVVDEGDRARWAAAMELYNSARAEGWTQEECSQVIQRFEQVSSQHQGGSLLEAIYMTGVVHDQCGHAEQAQQIYDRVLSANERFCGARVARGIQLYRQGNLQAARAEFERSIRDDTRCTEGYVNLAILQRRDAGTQAEALNNLRRALAIESAYLPAFNQMALLYLNTAMQRASATTGVAGGTAAVSGSQQQQSSDDESTQAARRAAARRAAAGQMLDLAEVVCRQAQLIDGNYAPIYNTWGLINVQQGNIIAALAKFERAFNLDPTMFEAYMNFGELTLSFRGYEDAERAFRRATELRGDNYDAWLGLGAALRGLNRIDDAMAAYQRAQQIDANRPESYFNVALIYSDYMGGTREQRTQAQEQYRQFAQRARGRPELAEIVAGVERECGCETAQQQGVRRDRRGRVVRVGRARRQCQSGRIEAITCAFALEDELMQMQREAEAMQRQIEEQARQMEAQQQQQEQQQATPPPEGGAPPPAQ